MTPGRYDFKPMKRGDTFRERLFVRLSKAGQPLEITAARMHVRTTLNQRLLAWDTADDSITLSGETVNNAVTLKEKGAGIMAKLPEGVHRYDLEVTLTNGVVRTYLEGAFPITHDATYP
jgi:hypothetical protein